MIHAENVSYSVSGKYLLSSIDAKLTPGRLSVIIGPNGAGKSTLLRLLTGELKPSQGSVLIKGRNLKTFVPAELARLRAVVPQHTLLAFPFTVIEVAQLGVTVPGLMAHGPRSQRLAEAMLDKLGILELADREYVSLSGGERQRVHIARALCQLEGSPADSAAIRALLVDEPTSNLDIAHQLEVLRELKLQAAQGRIVVAVLHDLNLAAAYADDILLLAEGRAQAFGPPAEVLTDDLLSAAYRCAVKLNHVPESAGPFLLPQACSIARNGSPI